MKIYLTLLILALLSCHTKTEKGKNNILTSRKENSSIDSSEMKNLKSDEVFLDSCENNKFISVLEGIPNRDSNAYRLTITSKNGKKKITKILDTRPEMSQINYCNDLYTVVGFSCGGPCYSQVFVFTDENRPIEQFGFGQKVKNNPNVIGHIKNEEFEKLIIHNFINSKELIVDISDNNFWNYGQMDSMIMKKDNLILYYTSENKKYITKKISLKPIL